MRHVSAVCALSVALAAFAQATPVTYSLIGPGSGEHTPEGLFTFMFEFRDPQGQPARLPADANMDQAIKDTSNYRVEADVPNADGALTPNTESRLLPVAKVTFGLRAGGAEDRTILIVYCSGVQYGRGTFTVREMRSPDGRCIVTPEKTSSQWQVDKPYTAAGRSPLRPSITFRGSTPVLEGSYSYTSKLKWPAAGGGKATRQWFDLEGSVPLTTPEDVKDTPGSETDASTRVADFIQASYRCSWYDGKHLAGAGVTARTTGRGHGLEVVGNWRPGAGFFADGRGFLGAEVEAGYRKGDAEWVNLTTRAPAHGNTALRAGAVIEYAPRIGKVNLDLGRGLRFYVRGRGWADAYDGGRFRGFGDSELFYNINDKWRVFGRYEVGYLPPDLSKRTDRWFLGTGVAF